MIIVFGFRSPSADDIGEILYHGDDRIEAMKIAEASDYPRVSYLDNPSPWMRPIKHWTDEAAAAYEKKHGAESVEHGEAAESAEDREYRREKYIAESVAKARADGYSESEVEDVRIHAGEVFDSENAA